MWMAIGSGWGGDGEWAQEIHVHVEVLVDLLILGVEMTDEQ